MMATTQPQKLWHLHRTSGGSRLRKVPCFNKTFIILKTTFNVNKSITFKTQFINFNSSILIHQF